MVIRCLRCLRQMRLHQTTEFDAVLRDRIQQLAKQLRIRRIPNIIVSDVLFGPAVLGLLRHTIVLPRCSFDDVGDGWRAERRKSPDDVTLPVMQRQRSYVLPLARMFWKALTKCATLKNHSVGTFGEFAGETKPAASAVGSQTHSSLALTRMPSTRESTRRSSVKFDDSPFAGGSSEDNPRRRRTFAWPSCELY
jgi:hypothetical protein